jgi:hypothetical protein
MKVTALARRSGLLNLTRQAALWQGRSVRDRPAVLATIKAGQTIDADES